MKNVDISYYHLMAHYYFIQFEQQHLMVVIKVRNILKDVSHYPDNSQVCSVLSFIAYQIQLRYIFKLAEVLFDILDGLNFYHIESF